MDNKQSPFKINMTFPTSEMLGKAILGKLETTEAWVVPIYPDTPDIESLLSKLQEQPDEEIKKQLKEILCGTCEDCESCRVNEVECHEVYEEISKIFPILKARDLKARNEERERIQCYLEDKFFLKRNTDTDTKVTFYKSMWRKMWQALNS